MDIKVGKDIVITNLNVEQKSKLQGYLKSKLEIDNPEFYKLQKMGKWTGRTQCKLILYQTITNGFILPFGALRDIYFLFLEEDVNYEIEFADLKDVDYKSKIKPYDYQEEAIQKAVKVKNGVIVAPCGAGKTEMALEIIARVGKPALWITHTKELLRQSKERAMKLYGLSDEQFGEITEGKVNISEITFATVQTLSKVNLEEIRDMFGIIIVDECHRIGGTPTNLMMFYTCLSRLNARYKIGVTATPKKSNGLDETMYSLLGKKICEIPKEVVEEKLCPVNIICVPTNYTPEIELITKTDGTIDYAKFINTLCEDETRNKIILACIDEVVGENKNCIVLSDRVAHLELLNKQRKDSNIITGKTRNREEILDSFKSGKTKVLFATYQLMAEGFDYKDLNTLVFATPQKNDRIVTQACGRVARKSDTKQYGEIYDLVDDFGMCLGMWKKRKSIYKKNNYEILD